MSNLARRWQALAPQLLSVLRIVAALMFLQSGTMKFFDWPMAMPGGGPPPVLSQVWIGGMLELVGGFLLMIGLFTRPVAFVLSGEMAVAYFQFHFPQGFWPIVNQGSRQSFTASSGYTYRLPGRDRGASMRCEAAAAGADELR